MQVNILNQKGEKEGMADLPENIFNVPWNADLVHQVITSLMSNSRHTIASTKDRSQVSGGGKKPWRQKHTGRARHGSIRSPLWKGGGISHGPKKEKVFDKKINKKMKKKALACVFSAKLKDNELFVIKGLEVKEAKTKNANLALKEFFGKLNLLDGGKKVKFPSALILTPQSDKALNRAVRNLSYTCVKEARNVGVMDILNNKAVLLFERAVEPIKDLFKTSK